MLSRGTAHIREGDAMFDKERFIEECRAALKEHDVHAAVRELVARAVSEPMQIVRSAGRTRARRS